MCKIVCCGGNRTRNLRFSGYESSIFNAHFKALTAECAGLTRQREIREGNMEFIGRAGEKSDE